jgi:hypothetical protein
MLNSIAKIAIDDEPSNLNKGSNERTNGEQVLKINTALLKKESAYHRYLP